MSFKKGHKKVPGSGRKKGQLSPITMDAVETLRKAGHDPIAFHLEMVMHSWNRYLGLLKKRQGYGANGALMVAREANADLLKYTHPTRKAVEHSGSIGQLSFSEMMQLAEQQAKEDEKE